MCGRAARCRYHAEGVRMDAIENAAGSSAALTGTLPVGLRADCTRGEEADGAPYRPPPPTHPPSQPPPPPPARPLAEDAVADVRLRPPLQPPAPSAFSSAFSSPTGTRDGSSSCLGDPSTGPTATPPRGLPVTRRALAPRRGAGPLLDPVVHAVRRALGWREDPEMAEMAEIAEVAEIRGQANRWWRIIS